MRFVDKIEKSLKKSPDIIESCITGVKDKAIYRKPAKDKFSIFDILGHLIEGEKKDWLVRADIIISDKKDKIFEPFDRFAMFCSSEGKTISDLISEFRELRLKNITRLKQLKLNQELLEMQGLHPELGKVNLKELLATWVAHDLNHILQIIKLLASEFEADVGPWKAYLGIFN